MTKNKIKLGYEIGTGEEETTIFGKIKELKRTSEDQQEEKRIVKIYDNILKRNVYCLLTDEEYKEICNIHRDKKDAKIKGILTQTDGKWFLNNAKLM